MSHLDLYRLGGLDDEDPALLADELGRRIAWRSSSGRRSAARSAWIPSAWPRACGLEHRGGDRRRVTIE